MRRTIKRRAHDLPELNMAALPDLIFTVLFFFMIVTHMRDVEKKVSYEVPAGQRMEQVGHRNNVIYIYIGKPTDSNDDSFQLQLGNAIAQPEDIPAFIKEQRAQMSEEDKERMTVCIRADRNTPMGLIGKVKQQLRNAYALNVTYAATEGKMSD